MAHREKIRGLAESAAGGQVGALLRRNAGKGWLLAIALALVAAFAVFVLPSLQRAQCAPAEVAKCPEMAAAAGQLDAIASKGTLPDYRRILPQRLAEILTPEEMSGVRAHNLSSSLFTGLPAFPKDLYELALLVKLRYVQGIHLALLDENYWKQPEFYPTFKTSGIGLMENPPQDKWGAYGMGSYPAEHFLDVRPGDRAVTANFFTASWLVVNRQAVSLNPREVVEGGEMDGADAGQYFAVAIEPREFLLGASWPAFEADWAQKAVISIDVSSSTPPGDYIVYVDTGQPSEEAIAKWDAEGRGYVLPAFASSVGRPLCAVHLRVLAN